MEPLKHIKDLIPYVPGKPVEELERELGISDAIKIASNENPVGPSPLATEAVKKHLNQTNRYPDGDCYYLKQKLSSFLGVETNNLIIGNGSNEIIELIARTYLSKNDEAIFGENAFIVYPIVTQAVGAKSVVSPMRNLTHDLDDISKRITAKTKVIFLANPNNPTGTIFNCKAFEKFLELVPDEIIVLIDEAYFEYVDTLDYPDSLRYRDKKPNLITVRTFSKIYGLAGYRIGYGVASKEMISYLNRVREPFNVNSLAQIAAMSALDDIEHVKKSKQINDIGLEYICGELDNLGVSYTPSFTNFVLIDLKQDPKDIYNNLLRRGVIVRPVGIYGLKTHLRVTVGLEKENKRFVDALKEVL